MKNALPCGRASVGVFVCVAMCLAQPADTWKPTALRNVSIQQRPGAEVALDVPLVDEAGRSVSLRAFSGKPIVLALVYYQCPSLCNMVLSGVARSVKDISLRAGEDFEIVAVSIDPHETPEMAAAKKPAERGWHYLTGPESSSRMIADSVGFHYFYDAMTNQYAHASAIIVITPEGRVSRYFYGIDYPARDLRLALVDASHHRVGSIVDQVMLYCYHWDPARGKYGFVIMNALRVAGGLTFAGLAGFMIVMFWRERRWRMT